MKKGNIVKEVKGKSECKLEITIRENDVEVRLVGEKGTEQLMADFLSDGFIPVGGKILEGIDMPDDLRAKLFGRWVKQIGKRLEELDFDNLDD